MTLMPTSSTSAPRTASSRRFTLSVFISQEGREICNFSLQSVDQLQADQDWDCSFDHKDFKIEISYHPTNKIQSITGDFTFNGTIFLRGNASWALLTRYIHFPYDGIRGVTFEETVSGFGETPLRIDVHSGLFLSKLRDMHTAPVS